MTDKDFKFHIPVELLKSSDGKKAEWKIQGIASTEDSDLQGETVVQDGLDISMLKTGRGLFNWDHQKGPENILGQIEDAGFIDKDGKKSLMVKGYLFKNQERAKAFYNILKSVKKANGPRVHMSIEGKILERDFIDQKKIKKARIDKVALTLDPVNPYTFAELVKSLNMTDNISEQDIENNEEIIEITRSDLEELVRDIITKTLSAGAGYTKAPEAMISGESQTKESLDKESKCMTYKGNKKYSKKMIKSILDSLKKAHPETDLEELAEWVIDSILDKLSKENYSD